MGAFLRLFVILGCLGCAVFACAEGDEAAAPTPPQEEAAATPPEETAAAAVPTLSEEDFANAQFIYFDRCSGCHGALRKGATGPNITDGEMLKKSLSELEEMIFEGTE
ncbi:MAG: hypothetical protein JRH19_26395, partial [Deltaproteobacteria bacterium]|nr:hypothetical protein [Deltaproteobacteria bacterium]